MTGRLENRRTRNSTNQPAQLHGHPRFLYVADCKLASRDNMGHIDRLGGRFVSVLPASRKEDKAFRDWIVDHEPAWADPDDVWHTTEAPWPSAEGYRIVRARSSAKVDYDAQARRDRIGRGIAAMDDLNQRLASPKTRMKTTLASSRRPPPRSSRSAPTDGSTAPSPSTPRKATGRRIAAAPVPTPATARSPGPTTASPSPSGRTSWPSTPPPTAATH